MSATAPDPTRADHRLVRKLLDTFYSGKVVHDPSAYDRVVAVFQQAGGSWERLFKGSPHDLNLLKRVLRVAYRKGVLPRVPAFP